MCIMYHRNGRYTIADRHPALLTMKGKQEVRRTSHWLCLAQDKELLSQESSAPLHPTPPRSHKGKGLTEEARSH